MRISITKYYRYYCTVYIHSRSLYVSSTSKLKRKFYFSQFFPIICNFVICEHILYAQQTHIWLSYMINRLDHIFHLSCLCFTFSSFTSLNKVVRWGHLQMQNQILNRIQYVQVWRRWCFLFTVQLNSVKYFKQIVQ